MKIHFTTPASLFCLCLGLSFSANATITGQWDFKAGNDNATIGSAISAVDPAAVAGTQFGLTSTFGIPPIGGQPTNVMRFPAALGPNGTYSVPVGAAGNDGGGNVNQYTVIMDLLITNLPSAGKTFTLFGTDYNGFGGEFFVTSSGAVGYSGGAGGHLTPNAWHRLAIGVDATNNSSGLSIYIDGTNVLEEGAPSTLDGSFSISGTIFLFDDPSTNTGSGYLASLQFNDVKLPDGLLSVLGAPVDTGIPTGPPSVPWIVSEAPLNNLANANLSTIPPEPLLQIVLNDGTTTVNTNTIVLKLNGANITPTINYAAPTTTISYQVPSLLPSLSSNTVLLTYQDSAGGSLEAQYVFDVGSYVALPASAAGALGTASTPGFIYRVAQGPSTGSIAGNLVQAQQLLDGTLLNSASIAYSNEATLSGTGYVTNDIFYVDQYEGNNGTICFTSGNSIGFSTLPNFSAYDFPGIPGADSDGTPNYDNFSDDVVAYVPLQAGTYIFGVAAGAGRVDNPPDNGYELRCGANPYDFFAPVVGEYVRTAENFTVGANTNTFSFIAPVSGVYPFRLIHWAPAPAAGGTGEADLAWYYIDPATGNQILINDPSGTISAYRESSIPREPYVAEVSPVPGGAGFPAAAPIIVLLSDDQLQVGSGSIKLFLNGAAVSPNSIVKKNGITSVTYYPDDNRTTITNEVELIYSDNGMPAKSFTNNWSFTIVLSAATVPPVTGQWDFNGNLKATVGADLKYFNAANNETSNACPFGTCSSFGIPLINGQDTTVMYRPGFADNSPILSSYGFVMTPGISPNGGGAKVNQYTIIYDLFITTTNSGVLTFFQCQNTNMPEGTDGSLFLQNGDMGQGGGGYNMNHGPVGYGWHRLAFAVDLSQNLITKWVDGVKAQDWVSSANGLDAARRAWQPNVLLFADNDGGTTGDDNNLSVYVSSIQVRSGKMSDAAMVLLGGPSAGKIPHSVPATSVTGQWDFNWSNLTATVGADLQYFNAANGETANACPFGTCSSFGIPPINGVDATVMYRPGFPDNSPILSSYGFIMTPQIAPNGGGTLVNQYTIIYDMFITTTNSGVMSLFECQNTNLPEGTDGSMFLQNGDIGQGGGGYTMNNGPVGYGWHRIGLAADLAQNLITKWVDGVKAQDWVSSANGLDAPRRAWQTNVLLFADNDGGTTGDDNTLSVYVKSIQVSSGKASDAQMMALGGVSAYGIPLAVPILNGSVSGGNVVFSWDTAFNGYRLYSTTDLANPSWAPVVGVDYAHNTFTVPTGEASGTFFRLIASTGSPLTSGGAGNEPSQ